jgi:outer membrane lipoprotein SlyB
MKKFIVPIALAISLMSGAAEAKGCLKGAVVGGVAGHFMHRHTVLGAVAGCVIGHHMAVTKERQEKAQQKQQQAQHQNTQTH